MAKSTDMYHVGIIGTGFGEKVHLPGFMNHDKFIPEIIAGRNQTKTKKIADEAGITATTDWKDLLQMDLDLVAVTTPPYLHYEMGKAVLDADINLLLEKPTTGNAEQAKELTALAGNKGLVGMMSHEFRWLPHRNYLADLVENEQKLGKLREVHFHNYYGFAATPDQPNFGWLWDSRYEGGMLGAIGSHLVDQVRDTTGREFLEISGYTTTRTPYRPDNNGDMQRVTADDGFGLNFTMQDDIIGSLTVTTSVSPTPQSSFILSGNQGTLELRDDDEIYFGEVGGEFEQLEIPEEYMLDTSLGEKDRRLPPFMKLLDQIKLALDDNTARRPSLTDGWRNQQVVDAVRKSTMTGSKVRIID